MTEEIHWVCSTCGAQFDIEGDGRVHLARFRHGVLYQRRKYRNSIKFNPSRRIQDRR